MIAVQKLKYMYVTCNGQPICKRVQKKYHYFPFIFLFSFLLHWYERCWVHGGIHCTLGYETWWRWRIKKKNTKENWCIFFLEHTHYLITREGGNKVIFVISKTLIKITSFPFLSRTDHRYIGEIIQWTLFFFSFFFF